MMNLNCQMVLILSQIFKIILNIYVKHETLTTIRFIHVYRKRLNNILVFNIKDKY